MCCSAFVGAYAIAVLNLVCVCVCLSMCVNFISVQCSESGLLVINYFIWCDLNVHKGFVAAYFL